MNNDINQRIEAIINLYNKGRNPNELMSMLVQRNPNFNQLNAQLRNMAQGRNMTEFLLQLAKQNGVNEQNLQVLARMLGAK